MDSEGNAHQKNEDSRFSEVDSEVLKIYLSHHITSMILCFSKGLLVLFFLYYGCVYAMYVTVNLLVRMMYN